MPTDDDRARDLLGRLNRLNPTIVVLAVAALFLGVLVLPDLAGAALVLVIAAGLGWLLTKTWPVLPSAARALRVAVIALLLLVALAKLFL
jgi:hypothetical protein